MELEEGKWYVTRDPKYGPVYVMRRVDYCGDFPWIGNNNGTYKDNGRTWYPNESSLDLVAEVRATNVPWVDE